MAKLNVVFSGVGMNKNGIVPVVDGDAHSAFDITTTGSSQASGTAAAKDGIAQLTITGGDVYVKFGKNPSVTSGTGFLMLDGSTRDFGVRAGYKVAVIDAAA